MKKKRWLAVFLAVLAAAGLIYGAGSVFAAGQRKTVIVVPASSLNYSWGDYENSMEGMVAAGATQDIYLLDTETVEEVLVETGQKVREGDVLLKYDATQTAINLDKELLAREKMELQLEVAEKNLETLLRIRPGSGGGLPEPFFPDPVIPEEPELPEVDAAEKLDGETEAYNEEKDSKDDPLGTESNPYRYLCREETVITGEFLNKLRQKALDKSGASDDPEKTPAPMYFILEVRDGNKSSGRLRKGWIMDAATLEKAPENWEGSVNLRGDVPKSGSDAKALSRLDAGAEPYNLDEDSEEDPLGSDTHPYRYLCTADAVITGAFLKEAAGKTGPDGAPAHYVLEVREGDSADGELRLSWKRQGAAEGEFEEDGEYTLAVTLLEKEKEDPGTDPEDPADPAGPGEGTDPGTGDPGTQGPGEPGDPGSGGGPGTEGPGEAGPGTDTPGGEDPGSEVPGGDPSAEEKPDAPAGNEGEQDGTGTEPEDDPAAVGTVMDVLPGRSTSLVLDVTGGQHLFFRLADGDPTGLISSDAFYTKEELEQAREEARKTIRDLTLDLREAEINISAARRALEEGEVLAAMDGTVTAVSDPDDPPSDGSPFLTVLSGNGRYIESGLNELYLGTVAEGDPVFLTSYMDGSSFEGTIKSISPYPDTSGRYGWGGTAAYYPMIISVTDPGVRLNEGDYLEVRVDSSAGSMVAADGGGKFYLWKAFIRDENGQKYVYKDDGGRLARQNIRVGSLSGESYEILSGITPEDYLAFPYGNAVREGAKTRQGSLDELYQ